MIIDGPLLQRAVQITTSDRPFNVFLELNLPSELPTGFGGYLEGAETAIYVPTDASNQLLADYSSQGPTVPVEVQGCPGTVRSPNANPFSRCALIIASISVRQQYLAQESC